MEKQNLEQQSMLYQGHRFLGGIKHFWMAVRVWKMNLIPEDLARQKRTKMWPKRGISWGLIGVWQSEWSVVCWIWITKLSTKFCLRTGHAENLCQAGPKNSHQWTEGKPKECVPGPSWMHWKWQNFFQTCHNRWWNVVFRIWSWHKMTKFGVSHEHLTTPKESKNEQIKNQNHANLLFRQSRCCS